jgi:calcium-dependent protein kinase
LLTIFQALDTNGDGQLSQDELESGYAKILGKEKAKQEVARIFRMVDTDGNGSIDYSEFVTACINKESILSKKRLKAAFRIFDKDNSGGIDMDELKEIFNNSGKLTNEEISLMIKEMDINGDGEIQFEEFIQGMEKLLKNTNS